MVGIYIGSTAARAGKNLVCMALGLALRQTGRNVGFMKPLGTLPRTVDEQTGDEDALLVQEVLGLSAPPEVLTPVIMPGNIRAAALSGGNALERVASAYGALSRGHDTMLVGGAGAFLTTGKARGVDGPSVVRRLDLKVLLVERYAHGIDYDAILYAKELLGDALAGVLCNDVPERYLRDAEEVLVPFLAERGVPVLGIVPNDPLLNAIKVSELAHRLGGRMVSGTARASRIVDGFLIGTMQVENFMAHFRRHANCATIVGGDRTDLQLVALEGQCPCLVLTGNIPPDEIIRARSEALGVPVIVVREDTYAVARKMEEILNSQKLRELVKIRRGADLVAHALDLARLTAQLGIQ